MSLEYIPDAQSMLSYGIPAFKHGRGVGAGFAAFQEHCLCFPFSGGVVVALRTGAERMHTEKWNDLFYSRNTPVLCARVEIGACAAGGNRKKTALIQQRARKGNAESKKRNLHPTVHNNT